MPKQREKERRHVNRRKVPVPSEMDWIGLARQELLPADFGGYIVHGSNKIESRHLP
jgi:hypothetical protein